MNKKDFLEKLSYEELEIIDNITHSELMRAIEAKKPRIPKAERVDISGNYYYYKAYDNTLYLIQVVEPDGDDWYKVNEIPIEEDEVDEYESSYEYKDLICYKPLDPKIYNLVRSRIRERDIAICNLNNQIREIIETLKL
jgi:hypothetical protein